MDFESLSKTKGEVFSMLRVALYLTFSVVSLVRFRLGCWDADFGHKGSRSFEPDHYWEERHRQPQREVDCCHLSHSNTIPEEEEAG